jgi:hypothetical protein
MSAVGRETLNGGDTLAHRARQRQGAGANRSAVDVHRARAALGDATAELGASQSQAVAQDPEERSLAGKVDRVLGAVHEEGKDWHGRTSALIYPLR